MTNMLFTLQPHEPLLIDIRESQDRTTHSEIYYTWKCHSRRVRPASHASFVLYRWEWGRGRGTHVLSAKAAIVILLSYWAIEHESPRAWTVLTGPIACLLYDRRTSSTLLYSCMRCAEHGSKTSYLSHQLLLFCSLQ